MSPNPKAKQPEPPYDSNTEDTMGAPSTRRKMTAPVYEPVYEWLLSVSTAGATYA